MDGAQTRGADAPLKEDTPQKQNRPRKVWARPEKNQETKTTVWGIHFFFSSAAIGTYGNSMRAPFWFMVDILFNWILQENCFHYCKVDLPSCKVGGGSNASTPAHLAVTLEEWTIAWYINLLVWLPQIWIVRTFRNKRNDVSKQIFTLANQNGTRCQAALHRKEAFIRKYTNWQQS